MKVPGPGAYETKSPQKIRAASYVFGSSPQRNSVIVKRSPGPAAYHIPCSIAELPGYTGARSKDFSVI